MTPNNIYIFRVSAENEVGKGLALETDLITMMDPLGKRVKSTLPIMMKKGKNTIHFYSDVPGQPQELQLIDISDKSLTVSWRAPKNDGGSKIIGYDLLFNKKDKDEVKPLRYSADDNVNNLTFL